MMPKISQREAQRLRRENRQLQQILDDQKKYWKESFGRDWINIAALEGDEAVLASINTARKLGHAVVVTSDVSTLTLAFYAVKL